MTQNTCQLATIQSDKIGPRLRQERKRLGLTQEAMAGVGGIRKLAQLNYEQGRHYPCLDYLLAVAAVGVDLWFVLHGVPSSENLTENEMTVLRAYRQLNADGKVRVSGFIEGVAASSSESALRPKP